MSTKPWRVLRFNSPQFAKQMAALNRHAQPEANRANIVAEVIATVRHEGDEALIKYAKKWDKVDLSRAGLLLPSRTPKPPAAVCAAIDYAIRNIKDFSK